MICYVKEVNVDTINLNGEAKEIIIKSYTWTNNGETGISYTYEMSKERYERKVKKAYEIYFEQAITVFASRMNYYDFVDYNISDCIGDSKIDSIARQLNHSSEEVLRSLLEQLEPLKKSIEEEFSKTEEYQKREEHQNIIEKYKEAKKEFGMMFGVEAKHYDCCYNVRGELMNEGYLNKIIAKSREREEYNYDSKNYRKKSYQYYHSTSLSTSNYDESDKIVLEKFYKTLAKKFHPDANPNMDTSQEMKLINQLKRDWGI